MKLMDWFALCMDNIGKEEGRSSGPYNEQQQLNNLLAR